MRRLSLLLCVLFFVSACSAQDAIVLPAALPQPVFPPPPRLAFSQAELAALKSSPNFSAMRDAAVKAADALLENPVVLPEGHGGWIFDYACPEDGSSLHAIKATQHECPRCKKIYSDSKTVTAYRASLHYEAEHAVQKLGHAYALSGEERFAQEAKRILLHFALAYPTYPTRQDRWGRTGILAHLGGRRFVQSLDEAVGIIRFAKGYDATRTSAVWSEQERELIEGDFFGLTAETLLQFNQGINNHQTWYNAGLMAIASVRSDAALVHKVLVMEGGYYDQLERSVGRDGIWYEGTMAYQNYALQAMREIVDAGRRMGLKLHEAPKFKTLLLGPLRAAYPNGQFPAINDSDRISIDVFNWSFDWAQKLYDEPLDTTLSTRSEDLPDAGLAILRQGSGRNAVSAFLDYGQHGGGHGHYDKLNLMLFANDREWLLDPGRLSYSHKEYKTWVKETAAHNTVTFNGQSQRPTKGELLWLQNGDGWSACAAESAQAYSEATLRRYLFLTSHMLVDVFETEAEEAGQWDWFAHAVVPAIVPLDNVGESTPKVPGERAGYQHLLDGRMWTLKGNSRWDFLSDEDRSEAPRLRMWLAGNEAEQIFTATGIGYNIGEKAPTLIRRRNGRSTRFLTIYDLTGRGDYVQNVEVPQKADAQLAVTTRDGKRELSFSPKNVHTVQSR